MLTHIEADESLPPQIEAAIDRLPALQVFTEPSSGRRYRPWTEVVITTRGSDTVRAESRPLANIGPTNLTASFELWIGDLSIRSDRLDSRVVDCAVAPRLSVAEQVRARIDRATTRELIRDQQSYWTLARWACTLLEQSPDLAATNSGLSGAYSSERLGLEVEFTNAPRMVTAISVRVSPDESERHEFSGRLRPTDHLPEHPTEWRTWRIPTPAGDGAAPARELLRFRRFLAAGVQDETSGGVFDLNQVDRLIDRATGQPVGQLRASGHAPNRTEIVPGAPTIRFQPPSSASDHGRSLLVVGISCLVVGAAIAIRRRLHAERS
ncbi:MAG: hypothetical protein KIT68_10465 [Phycisphaeraceae bacterium]|nr:hypothetical protein [Phycisphaeraceae bacterium]